MEESVDTLFEGRLAIVQGRSGYRFSLDSVLLAHFASPPAEGRVIDLGSGNGAIALMLAFLHPGARVVGLEIQHAMVERAARGMELNSLEGRVEWIHGDVREVGRLFRARSFDAAVCNPPYRLESSGRVNPDPEKRVARHEVRGSLRDFLRAGATLLRHGGKMAVVYPATRLLDLLETMRVEGMEPKRLRLVHSSGNTEAALVLTEGIRAGRPGLKILPPLVVYASGKEYTQELKSLLAGR
jgi:tRNA1Val (adenine37-N6)-methyltransferase